MFTYLLIGLGILLVIFLANLLKVMELTSNLRGSSQTQVSTKDNKTQGQLLFLFFFVFMAFVIWQMLEYGPRLLPESASEHGVDVDNLMNFNLIIIGVVFVLTHAVMFYFAMKYYGKEDRKAEYFVHSTKLEFIWTSVPAVFLAIIVIYGLATWNKMTGDVPEGALEIELYAKQFDWTARYGGSDNQLGRSNFRLIEGTNALGVDQTDERSLDDFTVKGEFVVPVNRPINFAFRSRDVIHSAYMPHFRAQMNCVPGMITNFHFTPILTTEQMREKTNNKEFTYTLLCNKICGAAHYNMKMDIIVVTEDEYNKWLKEQKPIFAKSQEQPAEKVVLTPDTAKIASIN